MTSAAAAAAAASAAEQQRLAAIAAYDVIDVEGDDPVLADLAAVSELAATLLGVPTAVINLIDDLMQYAVGAFGFDAAPRERNESMCQTTMSGGHDVYLPDAREDPTYAGSPWVDGRQGNVRMYCSTILRTPAGHAIGTLCVFDDQAHPIPPRQVHSLKLLARQIVDVLELRLRSRQLQQLNDELTQSQDRLAAFAGQVSHDLKAPITAIIGFTELLTDLDTIADDPSATSYVARCSSAARRMLGMIDDLLAFARVGSTLSVRPVGLDSVMPDVLTALDSLAADAEVTWSGPDVVADKAQLTALLKNLVGNSLAYRGDEPCVVQVLTEHVGENLVLRVIDNGTEVPAESRDAVVRPLVRLRKDLPGAGLGLAVCVRVMVGHGGSLRLDPTPGGGTTVTAVFPDA